MDATFFLTLGGFLNLIGLVLVPIFLLPLLTLVMPDVFASSSKILAANIDRGTGWALSIAIAAVIALFLLQLIVVIASYAFALSWTWLSELVIYAFATVFMLGAASALRDDAHVRVDILRPKFGEKGRNWVELAGTYLFLFPICIRILTTGEQGLTRSWSLFEGSRESDGLPLLFLFKTLVPAFAVLLLAQGLSVSLKAALRLTGKDDPTEKQSEPSGGAHGA